MKLEKCCKQQGECSLSGCSIFLPVRTTTEPWLRGQRGSQLKRIGKERRVIAIYPQWSRGCHQDLETGRQIPANTNILLFSHNQSITSAAFHTGMQLITAHTRLYTREKSCMFLFSNCYSNLLVSDWSESCSILCTLGVHSWLIQLTCVNYL